MSQTWIKIMGRKSKMKLPEGFNPGIKNDSLTMHLVAIKMVPLELAVEFSEFCNVTEKEEISWDYYFELLNAPLEVQNFCQNMNWTPKMKAVIYFEPTREWALKFGKRYSSKSNGNGAVFTTAVKLIVLAEMNLNNYWYEILPFEILEENYEKYEKGEYDEYYQDYINEYGKPPRIQKYFNEFEVWELNILPDYMSESKIRERHARVTERARD
jgi:hypothetical protein